MPRGARRLNIAGFAGLRNSSLLSPNSSFILYYICLEEYKMAFTAADVKKLREMTSVGMMECKDRKSTRLNSSH